MSKLDSTGTLWPAGFSPARDLDHAIAGAIRTFSRMIQIIMNHFQGEAQRHVEAERPEPSQIRRVNYCGAGSMTSPLQVVSGPVPKTNAHCRHHGIRQQWRLI